MLDWKKETSRWVVTFSFHLFFKNENSHTGRMDFRSKALTRTMQKTHPDARETSGFYYAKRAFLLHKRAL